MINLLCHFIALSYQDVFQRSESHAVFCCVQMRTHILLDTYSLLQLPRQSRETIKNANFYFSLIIRLKKTLRPDKIIKIG